jgi:membrane associated rhomboid family serine protease
MTLGQEGNALVQLVVINAVLFLILKFISLIYNLNPGGLQLFATKIFSWFALPASLDRLLSRPWTVLTFMFSDSELFRFIGNMVWLWGFGFILQDIMGNRKLVPLYLYGGVVAAVLYVAAYAIFPALRAGTGLASLSGANASVMAIAIATTTLAPDYRIFPMINGGIPLWIFTLLFIVIDFLGIRHGEYGLYIANLSGAATGFFFVLLVRRGIDGSIWMNRCFDWCNDLFNPGKKQRVRHPRDEYYYKVSGTQPFKRIPNITQQRIDEILDKINQQGYRFLTDEEKDILKRAADEEDL